MDTPIHLMAVYEIICLQNELIRAILKDSL